MIFKNIFYDNSESTKPFFDEDFKNVVIYQKFFWKCFGILVYSKPNWDFVQDANTLLLQSLSHKNMTE